MSDQERMPPADTGKPTLAVWKFASCDGCQLTLLDCEDELLAIADEIEIANFTEASSAVAVGAVRPVARRRVDHHAARRERIREVRQASRILVPIGACATAGGIQALRNFSDDFVPLVYATPCTSRRCARPRRSPTTCASTSSCAAAPSTAASCSR